MKTDIDNCIECERYTKVLHKLCATCAAKNHIRKTIMDRYRYYYCRYNNEGVEINALVVPPYNTQNTATIECTKIFLEHYQVPSLATYNFSCEIIRGDELKMMLEQGVKLLTHKNQQNA